jgi:hypothetical protein
VKIAEFLRSICSLDSQLTNNARREVELFPTAIERELNDYRLREVRECFEKASVLRFIENYTRAISGWKLIGKEGTTIVVGSKLSKPRVYLVNDWKCDCREFPKTGVACPHLILAAKEDGQKCYAELIKPCWRRARDE